MVGGAGLPTTTAAETDDREVVFEDVGELVDPPAVDYPLEVPTSLELPETTLTVHTDGCGVIRPELAEDPQGLQWTVEDLDGFSVLERNAIGETHLRYFQPGTYTVRLEAWGGESYVPISNTVEITC